MRIINSFALLVFYSSTIDFFYIGPYLLNLIISIKYICDSQDITTKLVKKNYLSINTLISDFLSFFNGYTRFICQDYNSYLGLDAIFNERCFLHLRKNNNDSMLMICREHSGSYQYEQLKSMGQISPKKELKIKNDKKIKINNDKILKFAKYKKAEKKYQYLGIEFNLNECNECYEDFDRIL